ncbi:MULTISPECIES: hypothetical protein [Niastella]|uniref:Uncharacterized protein n=1 Tax=Niastella soli TaxID=2821487 RepID=A0ABS3YXA1_9BACT|nr:hypothetical protein [Niastella soli]MBO9202137.1 hypothetical protein [Niastella soli]
MKKRTFLLTAAIMLSFGASMQATPTIKRLALTPGLRASAFAWNFIYAFGNGPVPGLTWSGNYLYISSGTYVVYSPANGYAFLTPSTPVYCNAVDNANTYVQVAVIGSNSPSYYDFMEY